MGRLPALTGVRGIAALSVLVFHALVYYDATGVAEPGQFWWFTAHYGYLGVDLFFVLSGFLLALPFIANSEGLLSRGTWLSFVGRRFIRTAPAYYVAIFLALFIAGNLAVLSTDPRTVLLHLAYLPTADAAALALINIAFWSLAVEFQFYLIMPLLLWALLRRPFTTLGALGALAFAWPYLLISFGGLDGRWVAVQTPGYLFHFALGMGAAMLHHRGWTPPVRASIMVPAALAFLVLLPNYLALPPPASWQGLDTAWAYTVWRAFPAMGFAVVVFCGASAKGWVADLLSSRPALHVGKISYSLYLTHVPLVFALPRIAPWTLDFGTAFFIVASIAISWPFAIGLYALVEAPSLRWKSLVGLRTPSALGTANAPAQAFAAEVNALRRALEAKPGTVHMETLRAGLPSDAHRG